MPCKEEEDKVNVSKLNNVKRVQDDHQFSSVVFCYIEVQKKLKAHYTLLTTQKRLEDVNMNSRGLSSPRFLKDTQ